MTASATCRSFVALLLIVGMSIGVCAQSGNMATDGATPEGLKAGAPAGSYQLSGFDNINYFNGNLNFSLPLMRVGGRGSAGVTIPLRIERKWQVSKTPSPPWANLPEPNDWQSVDPGYGPGVLIGRVVGKMPQSCQVEAGEYESLIRLTFTAGDGTEYELRDVSPLNGWQDITRYSYCSLVFEPNRGKVFVSADGSGVTFISDGDIKDGAQVSQIFPTGHLLLPDGTRYRIVDGRVLWIRDRNGNLIRFEYSSGWGVSKITDSLNREVTIAYGDDPATSYNDHDEITYKGFGVTNRTIKIWFSQMSQVLRAGSGYSIMKLGGATGLFPELDGSSATDFDVRVVSAVELPDNRTYQFKYNPYGELARVELPTGGAIEYDYWAGIAGAAESGSFGGGGAYIDKQVYRRVSKRRVYADKNSSVFEYETAISRPEATGGVNLGYVFVESRSYSNTLLSKEQRYYYGSARIPFGYMPYHYSYWTSGKEWKTTILASASTESQVVEQTWQQPQDGYFWPLTQGETDGTKRPNNPKVTQTLTTLVDTNQIAKQTFAYDPNFNQTDAYDYGYGVGAAGALVRRTHVDYLTSGYDAITGGLSNPNVAATIHIRNLPTQQIVYDAAGTQRAQTTYEYDVYTGDYHAGLTARSGISGLCNGNGYCPNGPNFTSTTYTTRGNVTKVSRWLDTGGTINTYAQYDVAGSVVKTIDPRSTNPSQPIATLFDFDDRFGSPNGEAQGNTIPTELQQSSQTSYAFPTKVTNAMGHVAYTQFDYYLGKPVDVEDPNQIKSSLYYADALDRPTKGVRSVGTSVQAQTNVFYDDTNRVITSASDKDTYAESDNSSNPGGVVAKSYYDGLGRIYRSAAYEGNTGSGTTWAITVSEFDALGRVKRTTNPFRATSPTAALPQSPEWTTTDYDLLGRVLTITTPDTAVVSTAYSGNQVTVTDQANKKRSSTTDALGRLTEVIEDPTTGGLGYQTTYLYDSLDNLRKVQQGGQSRFFAYDSLSRLIRARNPEQCASELPPRQCANVLLDLADPLTTNSEWSMAYSYDENGNLKTRTNALNVVATYAYDDLNRNTAVIYNDGTPNVQRSYDNANLANGKGRLWKSVSLVDGLAILRSEINEYDALGRVKSYTQGFYESSQWQDYTSLAGYDLAGNRTSERYPSGRGVLTAYSPLARIVSVGTHGSSAGANSSNLVSGMTYAPFGGLVAETYGSSSLVHAIQYNSRLQVTEIKLGTASVPDSILRLNYVYGTVNSVTGDDGQIATSQNNGSIGRIKYTISGTLKYSQTFQYDLLERLKFAIEHDDGVLQDAKRAWWQTFEYNRWGNRGLNTTSTSYTSTNMAQSGSALALGDFSESTNRITKTGYFYDLAGNLKVVPGREDNFDGENRLVSSTAAGVQSTYGYDADGKRVKKAVGSTVTKFVYNVAGQLIAEYGGSGTPSGESLQYATADHLGSPRVWTNAAASPTQQVVANGRHDYAPFGEELGPAYGTVRSGIAGYSGASQADGHRNQFIGYERDGETSLDFAQARYFSSTQGRFTSSDEPFAGQNEADPQTWNLYTYTSNNPLSRIDRDGRRWFYTSDQNGFETIWVNPNKDGSYTSPGAGWKEFIPTKAQPALILNAAGSQATILGEEEDGRPYVKTISTGVASDVSWEIVGWFIPARISAKGILAGASVLWARHLAEKAAMEALEGVSKNTLKHIAQHLDEFTRLDPAMTLEKVVSLGKQIASRSKNLISGPQGRKVFEEAVNIGGKQVKVKVVLKADGGLRSVYIRQ